jgi:hypothetical protein
VDDRVSLIELVEAVRKREQRGTCSTKHLYLEQTARTRARTT